MTGSVLPSAHALPYYPLCIVSTPIYGVNLQPRLQVKEKQVPLIILVHKARPPNLLSRRVRQLRKRLLVPMVRQEALPRTLQLADDEAQRRRALAVVLNGVCLQTKKDDR